jgi:hypothetical protein
MAYRLIGTVHTTLQVSKNSYIILTSYLLNIVSAILFVLTARRLYVKTTRGNIPFIL